MIDQHFTPNWLADLVAESLPAGLQGIAIDPTAGSGALLESLERGGHRRLNPVAIDSDPLVASRLRAAHPNWTVSTANALTPRSRGASHAWRLSKSVGVEVVLLNPPFSYRGGPSVRTALGSFTGRLSPAAQFVAMALTELRPRFGVIAILPNGVVNGQKYQRFWEEVRTHYEVSLVRELDNSSFPGVRARCSLLTITTPAFSKRVPDREPPPSAQKRVKVKLAGEARGASVDTTCRCIEVIRGRVPRHHPHSVATDAAPYLHTTHVREYQVTSTIDRAPRRLATYGPLVLLPRVGYPGGKIAVVDLPSVVLSDCLIALRPLGGAADKLAHHIREGLANLETMYNGTGAPYITLSQLERFLVSSGLHPIIVPASQPKGECRCSAVVKERRWPTDIAS